MDIDFKAAFVGAAQPEQQRRLLRKMSLPVLNQLLIHSIDCAGCLRRHCVDFRNFWAHQTGCRRKATAGCERCKRMAELFRYHVRYCRSDRCRLPNCETAKISHEMSQMAVRQSAMHKQQMQDWVMIMRSRENREAMVGDGNHMQLE